MRYIGAKNGKIQVFEGEKPQLEKGHLLVRTDFSAISPGTELSMAKNTQETPITLGYSASGTVVAMGDDVKGFSLGDQVATYGAPYTGHKEFMSIPQTLAARVPQSVSMRDAAMSGLGAIAIHALRQADLKFGEIAVVVGLGIYGQLISQIAHQAGLIVLPLNRSSQRAELLEEISNIPAYSDEGELEEALERVSQGRGADAVFLCVGGDSSYLTNKSLEWLRPRGKSVIVGDIKPNYDRPMMFAKEAEILISRAGGPGRYDPSYELSAIDYPYAYVRWTEGRNTAEFVRLLESQRIKVSDYYGQDYSFEDVEKAYESLDVPGAPYLSQVFNYQKK